MLLSIATQTKAAAFLKDFARPLERALYGFHFRSAGREGVLEALAPYQNADGGFGHGVEPDLASGASSVICTVRALELLAQVGAPPRHPLVGGAVAYLLAACDPATLLWEIVPRPVNDEPHAPWWHYDDDSAKQSAVWGGYRVNPRAEVVACLYSYASLVPPDFVRRVTDSLLTHLEGQAEPKDMHEIACWLTLIETAATPPALRERLVERLRPAVAHAVQRDPAKWDSYCLRPAGYMAAVRSPQSPLAEGLAEDVDRCLDFLIARQQPDGSWVPTWSWGEAYPAAWEQARRAWQGILTLATLRTLRAFGRLEAASGPTAA
jgi:hypothetical protein